MSKITEKDKEIQELRRYIRHLEDERDIAIEDIKWLVRGGVKDVCKLCTNRFADDPTNCLTCDDVWKNGNFDWKRKVTAEEWWKMRR